MAVSIVGDGDGVCLYREGVWGVGRVGKEEAEARGALL